MNSKPLVPEPRHLQPPDAPIRNAVASAMPRDTSQPRIREIYNHAWLKLDAGNQNSGTASSAKDSEKFWVVFCVHDDTEAFLEIYKKPELCSRHEPLSRVCLNACISVFPSLFGTCHEDEFSFVVSLPSQVIQFNAPSSEEMQEWVESLQGKLRDMNILKPKENVYSVVPEQSFTSSPYSTIDMYENDTSNSASSQRAYDYPMTTPAKPPENIRTAQGADPFQVYVNTLQVLERNGTAAAAAILSVRSQSSNSGNRAVNETAVPFTGSEFFTSPCPASVDCQKLYGYEIADIPSQHAINMSLVQSSGTKEERCPAKVYHHVIPPSLPPRNAQDKKIKIENSEAPHRRSSSLEYDVVRSALRNDNKSERRCNLRTETVNDTIGHLEALNIQPGSPANAEDSSSRPDSVQEASCIDSHLARSMGAGMLTHITLKDQQVMRLKSEIDNTGGLRIVLKKADCVGSIAFVEYRGSVWIAGWRQQIHPVLYYAFHVGDKVKKIAGISVQNCTDSIKAIRKASSVEIEFIVQRLPFGKAFALKRSREREDVGLVTIGHSAEVCEVVPTGLAAGQGLTPKAISGNGKPSCNWYLTEVNNRPLNLFPRENEVRERLNAVGREISFLVQPSDLVKHLRKHLKSIKGYTDYLLT